MRVIASDAGVSPRLSCTTSARRTGLRQACNEYAFTFFEGMIRRAGDRQPTEAMSQFGGVTDEAPPLMRYLMKQASEDSPAANDLVAQNRRVDQTVAGGQHGQGYVKPTVDPDMRAAILVMLRLGPFLLSGAVQQATGADILTGRPAAHVPHDDRDRRIRNLHPRRTPRGRAAWLYDANTEGEAHDR